MGRTREVLMHSNRTERSVVASRLMRMMAGHHDRYCTGIGGRGGWVDRRTLLRFSPLKKLQGLIIHLSEANDFTKLQAPELSDHIFKRSFERRIF